MCTNVHMNLLLTERRSAGDQQETFEKIETPTVTSSFGAMRSLGHDLSGATLREIQGQKSLFRSELSTGSDS